jgi:hypothetical protein
MDGGGNRYTIGEERRMSVKLSLELDQLKSLIDQLSDEEREELERYIRRRDREKAVSELEKARENAPLSMEEIVSEVRAVRRERARRRS